MEVWGCRYEEMEQKGEEVGGVPVITAAEDASGSTKSPALNGESLFVESNKTLPVSSLYKSVLESGAAHFASCRSTVSFRHHSLQPILMATC